MHRSAFVYSAVKMKYLGKKKQMLIVIHFEQVETRLSAIYRESAALQTGNN